LLKDQSDVTEAESLERAIHEKVHLRPYSSDWSHAFTAERDRIGQLFPQILAIEHIGSTAVEGMTAKPIIDIMAGVVSMAVAESLAAPLCQSGYTTSAEFNASLVDRKWFMRWADGHRTHHLHVVVHESTAWLERLKFRDALRAAPELAGQYEQLKQRAAVMHEQDREAYTLAKSDFVQAVVRR
jgi:GrpB-like predicted nucleotidyltransferase (UPF0157 family)